MIEKKPTRLHQPDALDAASLRQHISAWYDRAVVEASEAAGATGRGKHALQILDLALQLGVLNGVSKEDVLNLVAGRLESVTKQKAWNVGAYGNAKDRAADLFIHLTLNSIMQGFSLEEAAFERLTQHAAEIPVDAEVVKAEEFDLVFLPKAVREVKKPSDLLGKLFGDDEEMEDDEEEVQASPPAILQLLKDVQIGDEEPDLLQDEEVLHDVDDFIESPEEAAWTVQASDNILDEMTPPDFREIDLLLAQDRDPFFQTTSGKFNLDMQFLDAAVAGVEGSGFSIQESFLLKIAAMRCPCGVDSASYSAETCAKICGDKPCQAETSGLTQLWSLAKEAHTEQARKTLQGVAAFMLATDAFAPHLSAKTPDRVHTGR